ncbi:protein transport protein SEC31-like isoform 2 [Corchorus capsularis]|uniref:Protein transport protein SEC31-like isoform 2 n=1 Tax=Corchorus capsularis TaxID=210143 RepID=A0A1R3GG12_COCAP|nr:protein transport protein SEC31-like isoform 2 [Corchorus capsularis]
MTLKDTYVAPPSTAESDPHISVVSSVSETFIKDSEGLKTSIVSAIVNNDLMSLFNTGPLKFWKETLALICTFAQIEEWTVLCDTLALKLMAAGNTLAATLWYICAGNIDKTDLMEKTIVLALATGQKPFSESLCKLGEKYAEILAIQGLLTAAMEYLKLFGV